MTRSAGQFIARLRDASISTFNGNATAIAPLQKRAADAASSLGLPGKKTEAWKYTPVTDWLPDVFGLLGESEHPSLNATDLPADDVGYRVVTNNSVIDPTTSSLPPADTGVVICSLAAALKNHRDLILAHLAAYAKPEEGIFPALNAAILSSGLFVWIPKNVELDKPVYIIDRVFAESTSVRNHRLVIVCDQQSRSQIVVMNEPTYGSDLFENTVTEISVGREASVELEIIHDRGSAHSMVHSLAAHQDSDSHLSTNHFVFNGKMVRSDLHFVPDGTGCETHLNGIVIADESMHIDTHSMVDHVQPDCISNELFKYILADRATGVFNGKVLVRQDSQRINAYQTNRCIQLSPTTHMYAKPELEIYADDVRCSHGATTGRLDDEAIFYLQSRGLPLHEARLLLLEAYALEVVDLVRIEHVRTCLIERIREKLASQSAS